MTMLAVPVEDDELARLTATAQRVGVPLEQYARMVITHHVTKTVDGETADDDAVRQAAAASIREYGELYRRLAR